MENNNEALLNEQEKEKNYDKLLNERNDLAEKVTRLQEFIKDNDIREAPLTKQEILAEKDNGKRLQLIADNLHLFNVK